MFLFFLVIKQSWLIIIFFRFHLHRRIVLPKTLCFLPLHSTLHFEKVPQNHKWIFFLSNKTTKSYNKFLKFHLDRGVGLATTLCFLPLQASVWRPLTLVAEAEASLLRLLCYHNPGLACCAVCTSFHVRIMIMIIITIIIIMIMIMTIIIIIIIIIIIVIIIIIIIIIMIITTTTTWTTQKLIIPNIKLPHNTYPSPRRKEKL